jgi:hypothetical protein
MAHPRPSHLRRLVPALIAAAALVLPIAAAPSAAADEALPIGLFGVQPATFDGVYRQSLALLAYAAEGVEPPAEAVDWLLDQQCADGGFEAFRADPSGPCTAPDPDAFVGPDTNATAVAAQALLALGEDAAAEDALGYLESVQNSDGGIPTIDGGLSDANSTGLTAMAVSAAGLDLEDATASSGDSLADALDDLQVGCKGETSEQGAFAFRADFGINANDFATVQATIGRAGASLPVLPTNAAAFDAPRLDCGDGGTEDRAEAAAGYLAARLEANGGSFPMPSPRARPTGARPGSASSPSPPRVRAATRWSRPGRRWTTTRRSSWSTATGWTDLARSPNSSWPRTPLPPAWLPPASTSPTSAARLPWAPPTPVNCSSGSRRRSTRLRTTPVRLPTTIPAPNDGSGSPIPGDRCHQGRDRDRRHRERVRAVGVERSPAAARRHRSDHRGSTDSGGVIPMRPIVRPLATAAALALMAVLGGGVGAPGTANAASYRYWSFWVGAGDGWSYAQVGAGSTRPADGSVQGWRFAISAGASSSTIPPRVAASFATICGSDPAPEGRKRIGLVVDFGTTADAPTGETPPRGIARVCLEAPASATGAAVLAQAFAVRSKDGLVCGIDGYPRTECAAIVRDAAPTPSSRPTPTPTRERCRGPWRLHLARQRRLGRAGGGTGRASHGAGGDDAAGTRTPPTTPRCQQRGPAFGARGRSDRRGSGRRRPGAGDRSRGLRVRGARGVRSSRSCSSSRQGSAPGSCVGGRRDAARNPTANGGAPGPTTAAASAAACRSLVGVGLAARRRCESHDQCAAAGADRGCDRPGGVGPGRRDPVGAGLSGGASPRRSGHRHPAGLPGVLRRSPRHDRPVHPPVAAVAEWAAGVRVGGEVTLESLAAGFADGVRLATMIVCVGAANALTGPTRLLRSVPERSTKPGSRSSSR